MSHRPCGCIIGPPTYSKSIHSIHPQLEIIIYLCNRLNESPSPHLSLYSLSRIRHALKWALTPLSVIFFFLPWLCRGCFGSLRQTGLMICFDVLEVIKSSLQSNDSFLAISPSLSLYQCFAASRGEKVKIQDFSEEKDTKPRV